MSLNLLLRLTFCFNNFHFILFPDRYVIVGSNHHAGYGYNEQEWASSTAVITAFIQVLMLRVNKGWRPERTIVFCSWGGTTWGNIGSYEWGEVKKFINYNLQFYFHSFHSFIFQMFQSNIIEGK